MNKNKVTWSTAIIVLLLFLLLFIRVPVIQFDFGHSTYYVKEDSFQLFWIHSVEKEEWIEVYERKRDELVLTGTSFKTFGAGVPSEAECVETEDGYVHMKMDLSYREINLTISENVQTTILIEDREIPLYSLTEDYEIVNISVSNIPLWDYMGGEKL